MYQYSPLAPQQLRLLRPVSAFDPDDLRLEICHVSRDSSLRYTAVSYTWGNQQPTKTIRLNGKLFHVRPNLLSCLYYLSKARHNAELGWDWIWVDAICINQQNDKEKSEQVGLMDRTYSDAQMVSLWLGLVPVPKSPFPRNLLPSQEAFDNGQVVTFEDDSFDWYDHLDDLLNRPYWSRFWVIQEFLRARQIHYYCSDHVTDSFHLYELLTLETGNFGVSEFMNDDFRMISDAAAKQYTAASLILARNADMFPEQGSSLCNLLIRHRRAQCKDRRDRVFALLSLLGARELGLLSRFLPNYALSADQVVVIALAHMMNYQSSDHVEITVDSADLFQALGLEGSREKRKRMLSRARQFGYYDDWTGVDVARTMALQELLMTDYGALEDNAYDLIDIERISRHLGLSSINSRSRTKSMFKTLGGIAVLALTGALAVRYLSPK